MVERAAALEAAEKQLKEAQASIPKAELKAFKQSGVGKYINPKVFNKYVCLHLSLPGTLLYFTFCFILQARRCGWNRIQ